MKDVRGPILSFSALFVFRQGLSLILELDWWPANPSNPPVSSPHKTGICVWPCLAFYIGSGI